MSTAVKHVLVVDDKPENVYYLEALLGGHGYRVETAGHGAEALVRARSHPPDLVVSDLLMPVMDGYTLLRHWKADSRLARVPFIVYTATYTEPEDERLALSLGADAFILKPAEPDEFMARIRAVEDATRDGRGPGRPRALEDEPDLLKVYSQTLVRKLEEKTLQLEETNRSLQDEIAERRRMAETQAAILDALPAHIALVDAAGRIVAVNAAWRQRAAREGVLGGDDAVGGSYFEACERVSAERAADARSVADGLRRVLAGDLEQYETEYASAARDATRWFRLVITPLVDRDEGAVVMHVDVTDRHEAQAALERAASHQRELARRLEAERQRLAEAQAVAHMGSWETDLTTLQVTWSEETHRIFETDPASFRPTHQAFLEMVHPDDRQAVDEAFVSSASKGGGHALDHRILFPDGRVKVVQERWRVFHDALGQPVRAAGTCHDITERKQVEETLRESEERFRQLAETIEEVFWMTDPTKATMLYVSPAYEKIWGRPADALYEDARNWLDAIHSEDREEVRRALPRQQRGDYDVTYRVVRPDGSVRWVRDRAFPVRDASGRVYRIVGIAEDITERKAMEARFLRAQRMESIGTLAGGIAHDLNNVLTPILMSVELLKTDDDPAGREETIATIETSARKGADMVRQVLSFARGVEGRRVEVDVAHVLRDVGKIVDDTFLKAIQLRLVVAHDLPPVVGDPTQLHQVLLNLCVNARDAMPEGGTITIVARRDGEPGGGAAPTQPMVVITVSDTGTGMPPDVVERIFEPFFTTKELGRGTGLGLSTSLAIIQSHGGTLEVESAPGRGSTFTVRLPAGSTATRDGAGATFEATPRGRGQLILVVDDEAPIREISRRTLEAFGYRVTLAANGHEALTRFRERHGEVALVITDMMMPSMGGSATMRALRSIDPQVPIILVSGLAQGSEGRETPEGGGPTRYLAKPYSVEDLLKTVGSLVRG